MKNLIKGRNRSRLLSSVMLVIFTVVNITAHVLNGGFERTYMDDLLAVPMIYFTIKIIYTEEIKFLPEIIFAVKAALKGFKYLSQLGMPIVDNINFSEVMKDVIPYAEATFYCFVGMVGLHCGRILFKILRRTYDHRSRQRRRLMIAELTCIMLAVSTAAGYVMKITRYGCRITHINPRRSVPRLTVLKSYRFQTFTTSHSEPIPFFLSER